MDDWNLEIAPGRKLPPEEVEFRTSRSSGPGGQNVNKVESRVEARWNPVASRSLDADLVAKLLAHLGPRLHADGTLRAVSQRHRSQFQNRRAAAERLAEWVREALLPRKSRTRTRPTHSSKERRLDSKKRRSETKTQRRVSED